MPGGEDGTVSGTGPEPDRPIRERARKGVSRSSSGAGRGAGAKGNAFQSTRPLPEGKLYYRIGEVAKITGVKAHVLRYWETEFRWMAPPKSRSKQRLYRRKDIEMILVIKRLLYEERYTIAGARQQLRELGLAKALEGGPSAQADAQAVDAGEAPEAMTSGAGDPVSELRAGYRHIRAELESIRELL